MHLAPFLKAALALLNLHRASDKACYRLRCELQYSVKLDYFTRHGNGIRVLLHTSPRLYWLYPFGSQVLHVVGYLYQNYGWLSFLKWPLRLLTFPTFKVLQGKRHDTVYMIILILSSIAAALEPFLFPLFLRLSARRHLRPSGAR